MIEGFKKAMKAKFEMTDLGLMKYFLSMQAKQSPSQIFTFQEKYAKDLIKKFNMVDHTPLSTPMATNEKLSKYEDKENLDRSTYRRVVGSIIYLTST